MTDESTSLRWDVHVAAPEPLHAGDVAPGHEAPSWSPIQDIRDFDQIAETTSTAQDLYDQVIALYPDRINPDALWISAQGVKPSRASE